MSSPSDGILLIKNGTLIDGTSGTPRPNGRIVIRSGKIAEVGPEAPFDQVGGARVIDALRCGANGPLRYRSKFSQQGSKARNFGGHAHARARLG